MSLCRRDTELKAEHFSFCGAPCQAKWRTKGLKVALKVLKLTCASLAKGPFLEHKGGMSIRSLLQPSEAAFPTWWSLFGVFCCCFVKTVS